MPIDMKELQETDERFLYIRKQSEIRVMIIDFLKENKNQAYLCGEIFEELKKVLNEKIKLNPQYIRALNIVSNQRIINLLVLMKKEPTSRVDRKGSYYFYNEKKYKNKK